MKSGRPAETEEKNGKRSEGKGGRIAAFRITMIIIPS